jgi:hypothetical protein
MNGEKQMTEPHVQAERTPLQSAEETKAGPHRLNTESTDAQSPQVLAKRTAMEVGQTLSNESLETAYLEFTDVLDVAKTSMSGADFKKYRKELTTALEEKGVLPQLSLAWADKAFSKLDADNSQSVEKREAEAYAEDANGVDALSASMAKNFAELMFPNQMSDMPVKREDLRSLIDANNPRARREEQSRVVVSFLAQPREDLFGMNLFEALDMIGSQGNPNKFDGEISKGDIEALLSNPEGIRRYYHLSKQDNAFLNSMLDNWEYPDVKRLTDERGLITPDSIKVATGELRAQRAQESLRRQQQEKDAEEIRLFGIKLPSTIKL